MVTKNFSCFDIICPKALKIYERLNSRPHAWESDYLELNDAIVELVEIEIDRFNARKEFGCPYPIYCPFKEH